MTSPNSYTRSPNSTYIKGPLQDNSKVQCHISSNVPEKLRTIYPSDKSANSIDDAPQDNISMASSGNWDFFTIGG
jgi:hypothetical protein